MVNLTQSVSVAIVFTRTPYDKGPKEEYYAQVRIMSILGYNYMYQDMRGRYSSGGIYFQCIAIVGIKMAITQAIPHFGPL